MNQLNQQVQSTVVEVMWIQGFIGVLTTIAMVSYFVAEILKQVFPGAKE